MCYVWFLDFFHKIEVLKNYEMMSPSIENYESQQKRTAQEVGSKVEILKKHIHKAKVFLYELRLFIRENHFESDKDEIHFFKNVKPKICADLTFYSEQLEYEVLKPNSSISVQKQYVKSVLKKLESHKRKNIVFYKYYKQKGTVLDHIYFLRGNEQLELFNVSLIPSLDPEFFTSHCLLASQVLSYDLLTEFYKKELLNLKKIENGHFNTSVESSIDWNINWTASKTDLIELIYALKVSGAIDGGVGNINQISKVLSELFNVELGNFYKTYSEIKNRSKDRTKFLNKLVQSLQAKLDYDDSL